MADGATTGRLTTNRRMYWRIVGRMLLGNRPRLVAILLALGAGATVSAALLNLEIDAKRRLTSEFKAFGPNVVVAPNTSAAAGQAETLAESTRDLIPKAQGSVSLSSFLYLISKVSLAQTGKSVNAVVVGHEPFASLFAMHSNASLNWPGASCVLGSKVAAQLNAAKESELTFESRGTETCRVKKIVTTGGHEDSEVWIDLPSSQRLAGMPGRVSAIELTVSGTPPEIQSYIAQLQRALPDLEVRPVRQFTEAQAKIYDRISGLLNLTVGVVLALTALSVMAAMANVAIERRNDVGLMKAVGGATRRVVRLFLAEAAILGLIGGVVGGAVGIGLSIYLGKAVFGLAARPRWVVYPVSVMLTLAVAILAASPLRHLAAIRPASVFRGET
jgi:putative ABC transport system permease protein